MPPQLTLLTTRLAAHLSRRLQSILHEADSDMVELLHAAFLLLCWGVWLTLPGDTFSSARTYAPMARFGSETTWGAVFGALGLLQGLCVLDGRVSWRLLSAWLCLGAWLFIFSCFIVGNFWGVGVPFYLLFVGSASWVIWRLNRR